MTLPTAPTPEQVFAAKLAAAGLNREQIAVVMSLVEGEARKWAAHYQRRLERAIQLTYGGTYRHPLDMD